MENGVVLGEHDKECSDDAEVQKLKDLVKKLEKQNEHLRNRTGRLTNNSNKLPRSIKTSDANAGGDMIYRPKAPSSGDGDDLSELDEYDVPGFGLDKDEELSWLYSSPVIKSNSWSDTNNSSCALSPHDWLSDELEHPSTPQLASAKRNIMYKLNGSFDRSSPDIGYLQRKIEKKLGIADDYGTEDSGDYLLKEEIQKTDDFPVNHAINESDDQSYVTDEARFVPLRKYSTASSGSSHSPAAGHVPRRASVDEVEWNSASSGSPHHIHHLPLPSQTMTTAHGLQPIGTVVEDDTTSAARLTGQDKHREKQTIKKHPPSVKGSNTPTRMDGRFNSRRSDRSSPPRAKSPAARNTGKPQVRRSLPNPSRLRPSSSLASSSLPGELNRKNSNESSPSVSPHRPVIKSSLAAPPSRLSKLTARSTAAAPSTNASRSIPVARSNSPKPQQQRRTLPRPSQTSASSFKYMPTTTRSSTLTRNGPTAPNKSASEPSAPGNSGGASDIWGNDEVY